MLRKLLNPKPGGNYHLLKFTARVQCYGTEQEQYQALDVAAEKTSKHSTKVYEIIGKFTPQEEEKILHSVNNYKLKEFLSYDISKTRANKLLAYRMRNGLFKELIDIFFVEGFGLKVADKFYQSLLQEPKALDVDLGKKQRARTAPFVTPSLEPEQRAKIKTCVAVRIGVNSITWSKLELSPADSYDPCLLTHWQHHEISQKKLHLNELIQRCLYVCHQIPTADCYLFENPQMVQASNNPGSVDQQNINIQKAQVIAVMGYALAARNNENHTVAPTDEEPNKKRVKFPTLFYVRRFLTARLFNHLVGTERISSEQTILEMMRTYYNTEEMEDFDRAEERPTVLEGKLEQSADKNCLTIRGNVQFPMELRQMFSKAPRYHRELLGQALLLNLAFVRLVLLQDDESIAQVSRGGKKKNNSEIEDV